MKRTLTHLFFVVVLASQYTVMAQAVVFEYRSSVPTDAAYVPQYAEWVDADNDGLLDVLIFSKAADETWVMEWYRNDSLDFVAQPVITTELTDASFMVIDYDYDNRLDIVASGKELGADKTEVFLNDGDFAFTPSDLLPVYAETITFADLNADGRRELILSSRSQPAINIYRMREGTWQLVSDSVKIFARTIFAYDFNLDFYTDLLISGETQDGSPVQLILENRKGFYFVESSPLSSIRNASVVMADLNLDGNPDYLVTGEDDSAQPKSVVYFGSGSLSPVVRDTTLSENVITHLFAADLTSDGLVDVNVVSTRAVNQENRVIVRDGYDFSLSSSNWVHQRFGDADRDGDLDLVQVQNDAFLYFENARDEVNDGPEGPTGALGAILFDRLFIFWPDGVDDHSPQEAITYDLVVSGPGEEIIAGDFDLFNEARLQVAHGNSGFNNFVLLRDKEAVTYNIVIQSIDNALHARIRTEKTVSGGVCYGTAAPCEIPIEEIVACSDEEVNLEEPTAAHWFSFTDGYLGLSADLTYTSAAGDTLFSLIPGSTAACSAVKLYTIQRTDTASREEETVRYVCAGTTLHFEAEDNWEQVTWESALSGFISNEKTLDLTVTKNDTITATLVNGAGCTLVRKTALILSQPDSLAGETTYQIVKGQSVELQAQVAGATAYRWQPAAGLSRDDIPNPIATPVASTEYTVTISDSLGCSSMARFTILVENTAFVPTLFTPNFDGKNDQLKIYGLGDVTDISFRIYNREGNLVFRADTPTAAESQGWDGTVGGVLQPAGVYHWKIEGRYANGDRLLLNGKETGSFVLIR